MVKKNQTIWVLTDSETDYYTMTGKFLRAYLTKPNLSTLLNFLFKVDVEKATENQILGVAELMREGQTEIDQTIYGLEEVTLYE